MTSEAQIRTKTRLIRICDPVIIRNNCYTLIIKSLDAILFACPDELEISESSRFFFEKKDPDPFGIK